MPKQRRSNADIRNNKKPKYSHKNKANGDDYNVDDILDYRFAQKSGLEFWVSWCGYDHSHNTWSTLDNLRLNMTLDKHVDDIFEHHETEIFVALANIKEKIKYRIRAAYREKSKLEVMLQMQPFDPKEFRIVQAVNQKYKNPPLEFIKYFEDLVFKNYFFRLDMVQRIQHNELINNCKKVDKDIILDIENDVDFDAPPAFNYVKKNFLADVHNNSTLIESPTKMTTMKGCSCENGMCSKSSNCCPKLVREGFAYRRYRNGQDLLQFKETEKIYECNINCSCPPECLNRVSQRPSLVPLCLFKTDGRGWGLKVMKDIKQGTFILEYAGEMLGNQEAGKRQETRYLFDLNMDRAPNGFYTIDANYHGSLGRFVNHSCEPNCKMWFINDCMQEPDSQKLCIFASRDMEKDEEITIDYSPKDSVPVDRCNNTTYHSVDECFCGTASCRGRIY